MDIRYTIDDSNIHIFDSCFISKRNFGDCLDYIKEENPQNNVLNKRKKCGMKLEWALHNFLYVLHIARSHTQDVDLNYPRKWWEPIVYDVMGVLVWVFIP